VSYKVAGIDVHKKMLMVVVTDATTPEEKTERRRFATMPSEMRRLSVWLRGQGVEEAVMESTAQYWRSVWLELDFWGGDLSRKRRKRRREPQQSLRQGQ